MLREEQSDGAHSSPFDHDDAPERGPPAIGIVGGGPSAAYTLKYLVERLDKGRIVLFEAGERAGVGTPFARRNNPRSMLANIADIELPPLTHSLLDWLRQLPAAARSDLGVTCDQLDERHFFPRMVLGEYFAQQVDALVAAGRAKGLAIEIRTRTPVDDLVAHAGQIEVVARRGPFRTAEMFDYVVLATGHQAPRPLADAPGLLRPYGGHARVAFLRRLGIIGSSLSAIDVAVAQAFRVGSFERVGGALVFYPRAGEEDRSITMLSRSGLLPEADFYCPIPYEPLSLFTREAVEQAASGDQALDRVFALFAAELAAVDPDYAARIDLAKCTADSFADRYFAARQGADPFAWAEANLVEAKRNAEARHTVPWRYAILRMHELFGEVRASFSASDAERFDAGLKRVFIDNYAAVPPQSIERILALHRAGVLSLHRLEQDYTMDCDADGQWTVSDYGDAWTFDGIVDARGQGALGQEDFPFPTLRMQIRASALRNGATTDAIPMTRDNALAAQGDPLARVFCLSLPFLMWRNPFVQGLTAAHDIGRAAAKAIVDSIGEVGEATHWREDIHRLIGELDETVPIYCGTPTGAVPVHLPVAAAQ